METKEYIENRINTKIREYEKLSSKYHKVHIGLMISCFCCLFASIVLHVLYLILPVVWFILASVVLIVASLFLFFFDVLNDYSSKSSEYKHKALMLSYEMNLYLAKESDFESLGYRCEKWM
ncbi:hypothetical protein [uncultured Holdemanella sp.]|uniref:hypothetical protein n=1 Tax=uncultured Holdemanella sp. TaxID=1763549 RepID=UPI0025FC7E5E|nr:hypothetical protein [uncultured Holdemanella sp.]